MRDRDWTPDELQMRIRSLEAERLRPVPPTPATARRAPIAHVLDLIRDLDDDQEDN